MLCVSLNATRSCLTQGAENDACTRLPNLYLTLCDLDCLTAWLKLVVSWAPSPVDSFWKYCVHKFDYWQRNGQTNGQVENIVPAAVSLAWCRYIECFYVHCAIGALQTVGLWWWVTNDEERWGGKLPSSAVQCTDDCDGQHAVIVILAACHEID